jgi:hypothetical protein
MSIVANVGSSLFHGVVDVDFHVTIVSVSIRIMIRFRVRIGVATIFN